LIGINIITKEGILLFSKFFERSSPLRSDVDEDLRAGLMTAAMNAFQVDNRDNSNIRTINQGSYHVIIVEGKTVFGIFFTHEDTLKERNFAIMIVFEFEKKYKNDITEISLEEGRFEGFYSYLEDEYQKFIQVDVKNLPVMLEIMNNSEFSDYVILEKPYLHQVFTTVSIDEVKNHAPLLIQVIKEVLESGNIVQLPIDQLRINFAKRFSLILFTYRKYVILVFTSSRDEERALRDLYKLRTKIDAIS